MNKLTNEPTDIDPPFGVRLRFWTTTGLRTANQTVVFQVDGHAVTLSSPDGKPLQNGGWYCLMATGFRNREEAQAFGSHLNTALQIASIRRMLGVDVGCGQATSSLGKVFHDQLAEWGRFVRPNVHGLDVFEDRLGTEWYNESSEGFVSTDATGILDDIAMLARKVGDQESPKFDAVRLMNEALVAVEATTKLTLAIAAVEMLVPREEWTSTQKKLIKQISRMLESDTTVSDEERQELTDAVERMYKPSVLRGLRHLLEQQGLSDLWSRWSDLYNDRSRILHGLSYATPMDRQRMVAPTVLLSARIVLTALNAYVSGAAADLDTILLLPKVYVKFDADL